MEQMIGAVIPWGINGTARDDPYTDLASAVVAQAAKDYIKILRKLWKKDITVQARRGLFWCCIIKLDTSLSRIYKKSSEDGGQNGTEKS